MKAGRFIRGLGVGLLAAAVVAGCVMLVQSGKKQNDTDENGGERTVTESPLEQPTEDVSSATEQVPAPTQEAVVTEMPSATENAVPETTGAAKTASPEVLPSPETDTAKKKTVEITRGLDSAAVAQKLEEEGIIDDAESFDRYLEQGGYSNRIIMGTYELIPGESYESLAKKIAGESK